MVGPGHVACHALVHRPVLLLPQLHLRIGVSSSRAGSAYVWAQAKATPIKSCKSPLASHEIVRLEHLRNRRPLLRCMWGA